MSFTGDVLLYNEADVTDATFNSDPPYDLGWAREGSLAILCDNWGNIDNTLTVAVYWGVHKRGFAQTIDYITWEADPSLTKQIVATGGTTTEVSGVLSIPTMKSKFMRVTFTLAGTDKEVDVSVWFYGKN